jgi:hypothetical protein
MAVREHTAPMLKTLLLVALLLQAGAVLAESVSASILFRVNIPIVVKLVVKDGKVQVFTNARRGQLSYRLRDTPEVALP